MPFRVNITMTNELFHCKKFNNNKYLFKSEHMIAIGEKLPDFKVKCVNIGELETITNNNLKGSWTILFFYPENFSFICPTEVTGFNDYKEELESQNVKIIGVSVDSLESHKQWIEELGISYPLVSDINGVLSKDLGVLDTEDGRSNRATFIINPDLIIEFIMVTSRNVGRSVKETIRVISALQSGRQCPVDYDSTSLRENI